jgi:alpha-D-xyloside xylohydrolase
MAESLRGGLSLGACGFGYWSHDIGGFEGSPPAHIYKRWIAFGLMSSHSRLHGSSSYRVPWLFDDEACDVLRHFTKLKCRLMPYLYGAAEEAHQTGVPMMRAMVLEYPDDPGCDTLDRQYMLGSNLLVAPVLAESGEVDFYLPAGKWVHLLSGEEREGGWHRTKHGFLDMPLYVPAGSVLVTGVTDDRPDYDFAEGMTVCLYEIDDGTTVVTTVPGQGDASATQVTVTRAGAKISVRLAGRVPRVWSVRALPATEVVAALAGSDSVELDVSS